jgi:hypothetical protein
LLLLLWLLLLWLLRRLWLLLVVLRMVEPLLWHRLHLLRREDGQRGGLRVRGLMLRVLERLSHRGHLEIVSPITHFYL